MAVYKKTYFAEAGAHIIDDPALALGVIYDVSRSVDLTEVPYGTDPLPGQFSYHSPTGRLTFSEDEPFNDSAGPSYAPGEPVTVIYKAIGAPVLPPPEPPTECPTPSPTLEITAPGVVRVRMPALGNYLVDIIPAAGSCGDTPLQSATITGGDSYISSLLPAGFYKACVRRDCGGGMLSPAAASNTIEIVLPPANFGARKVPADTEIKILSVTGFPYVIRSGSFPLSSALQEMSARHEGFTAVISVAVQVKKKQQVVVGLYKNGPLVQFLVAYRTTPGNVTLNFTSITATASDNIFVALDYT